MMYISDSLLIFISLIILIFIIVGGCLLAYFEHKSNHSKLLMNDVRNKTLLKLDFWDEWFVRFFYLWFFIKSIIFGVSFIFISLNMELIIIHPVLVFYFLFVDIVILESIFNNGEIILMMRERGLIK